MKGANACLKNFHLKVMKYLQIPYMEIQFRILDEKCVSIIRLYDWFFSIIDSKFCDFGKYVYEGRMWVCDIMQFKVYFSLGYYVDM